MAEASQGAQARLCLEPGAAPHTFDASSEPYEFVAESVRKRGKILDTSGIRGTRSHHVSRTRAGTYEVGGSLTLHPSPADLDLLLPRILGAAESSDTFNLAESLPAFGILIDRVAETFQYTPAVVRIDGPVLGFEPVLGPTDASPGVISAEGRGFMPLGDALPDPWRVPASYGWQHFNPRMIRFRLPEAGLKRTEQTVAGAETLNFWDGYGAKPHLLTVWNLPIRDDYLFGGTHLRNGLAVYDDRLDRYRIVNLESG